MQIRIAGSSPVDETKSWQDFISTSSVALNRVSGFGQFPARRSKASADVHIFSVQRRHPFLCRRCAIVRLRLAGVIAGLMSVAERRWILVGAWGSRKGLFP